MSEQAGLGMVKGYFNYIESSAGVDGRLLAR